MSDREVCVHGVPIAGLSCSECADQAVRLSYTAFLAQRDELLAALREIAPYLSNHWAQDRARAAITKAQGHQP
jgi:hypothetical protein